MPPILNPLISFAKRVRNYLSFSAFAIIALVIVFLWIFSAGSFDTTLQKLGEERSFQILLIVIGLTFTTILLLIVLSFIETRPTSKSKAGEPLFVKVHAKSDKTQGIPEDNIQDKVRYNQRHDDLYTSQKSRKCVCENDGLASTRI